MEDEKNVFDLEEKNLKEELGGKMCSCFNQKGDYFETIIQNGNFVLEARASIKSTCSMRLLKYKETRKLRTARRDSVGRGKWNT